MESCEASRHKTLTNFFHPRQLDTIKNKRCHPYLESWNVAKKISEFFSVHCCWRHDEFHISSTRYNLHKIIFWKLILPCLNKRCCPCCFLLLSILCYYQQKYKLLNWTCLRSRMNNLYKRLKKNLKKFRLDRESNTDIAMTRRDALSNWAN